MYFSVVVLRWVARSAHSTISVMPLVSISLRNVTRRYSLTKFACRIILLEIACGVLQDLRCVARRVGMIGGSDW